MYLLIGSSILIVISIQLLDCNKTLLIHEALITLHLNNGKYFYKPRKNAVCLVSSLLNPKILCFHTCCSFSDYIKYALMLTQEQLKANLKLNRLLEIQKCVDSMCQRANCFVVRWYGVRIIISLKQLSQHNTLFKK